MKYIYILWKSIFNLENGKSPQLKEHTRAKISLVCENKMLTVRQNFLLIGMSEANQDLKLIFQLGGWFTVLHHTELGGWFTVLHHTELGGMVYCTASHRTGTP